MKLPLTAAESVLPPTEWQRIQREARQRLPVDFELEFELLEEPYRTRRNKIPMIVPERGHRAATHSEG